MFDELTNRIEKLISAKDHTVVAVSGFGGSGETTLAEKLKEHFSDSTLLQLDNFLIDRGQGEGWQGGYDWDRLRRVLADIHQGKDLYYQWYNWEKDETRDWVSQPLPRLIIVEGVRLLQPSLMPFFDLTVWIDCTIDLATERGKARDRANKPGSGFDIETHIKKWDEIWAPKDKEFERLFKPMEHADLIYR